MLWCQSAIKILHLGTIIYLPYLNIQKSSLCSRLVMSRIQLISISMWVESSSIPWRNHLCLRLDAIAGLLQHGICSYFSSWYNTIVLHIELVPRFRPRNNHVFLEQYDRWWTLISLILFFNMTKFNHTKSCLTLCHHT